MAESTVYVDTNTELDTLSKRKKKKKADRSAVKLGAPRILIFYGAQGLCGLKAVKQP